MWRFEKRKKIIRLQDIEDIKQNPESDMKNVHPVNQSKQLHLLNAKQWKTKQL